MALVIARVTLLAYLLVVALATTAGMSVSAVGAPGSGATLAAAADDVRDDGDALAADLDGDDDLDDAIADSDSDASDDDAIPPAAGAIVAPAGSLQLAAAQQSASPSPPLGSLFRPPCSASV